MGSMSRPTPAERIAACLVYGALGDALGADVEFDLWFQIRQRYGPLGVVSFPFHARFTDDTQMTLFTCEGLIRARRLLDDPVVVQDEVFFAYLRWLVTQGDAWVHVPGAPASPDGWLVAQSVLQVQRAPGLTCLSALRSHTPGTPEAPVNDSKGCGGVMRAAPAGFFATSLEEAVELGCAVAALTHGHPDGYYPAGFLAGVIWLLLAGVSLSRAVSEVSALLASYPQAAGTLQAVSSAVAVGSPAMPNATQLESLGGGWVGDEALAIALACALPVAGGSADVSEALCAAVNHSGDSDSTGSICGNLLGAEFGLWQVPASWLESLEGFELVALVAADVAAVREGGPLSAEFGRRYPAA